jgi:hypothetical protein
MAKNKEVPHRNFGVPPVRWYANYRTLYCLTMRISIATSSLIWLGKLRKCWKFGVSKSSERVFVHALRRHISTSSVCSIVNSDSEHIVHFFMPWQLPEFTWKITGNLPEIAHEQLLGGCCTPHTLGRYGPGKIIPKISISGIKLWSQCREVSKDTYKLACIIRERNLLYLPTFHCFDQIY